MLYPVRTFCTKPWTLELATLATLWQGVLPSGLVPPSAVPRAEDIVQYTIKLPSLKSPSKSYVPHWMLVLYNEPKFGKPPRNIRTLLWDNNAGDSKTGSQAIIESGICCLTTFKWDEHIQEATFWMAKEAFEEMIGWQVYAWRTDVWEKEGKGVELGKAVVKRMSWNEWNDPSSFAVDVNIW